MSEPGSTCRICGRALSNPVSVARGIGPHCWAALKTYREIVEEAAKIDDEV